MSGNMAICEVNQDLQVALKEFRFRKETGQTSAIIIKVDRESHTLVIDQTFDDVTIEDLVENLPSHQPRYVVLSYRLQHEDDAKRISYPLCFIFISPADCSPELQMMYAGSKLRLQSTLGLSRAFELRELEEFTEEWLKEKLRR